METVEGPRARDARERLEALLAGRSPAVAMERQYIIMSRSGLLDASGRPFDWADLSGKIAFCNGRPEIYDRYAFGFPTTPPARDE
jgi:hypothetical protein